MFYVYDIIATLTFQVLIQKIPLHFIFCGMKFVWIETTIKKGDRCIYCALNILIIQ